MSHLFRNTTSAGTPTCLASRMCSRVCGIGPSAADTTKDATVHLGGTGDHVLHIVGVARAIDVGIVPVGSFVFDVSGRDRDAARLLFRRLVDLVVRGERRTAGFRQHLGDRRRQRRLAMVDVTDGSDVAVRFITFKLCFGHLTLRSIVELVNQR